MSMIMFVMVISGKLSSAIIVQSPSTLVPASSATFKVATRDSFGMNICSNATVHATVSAQDPQQDLGQSASESVNGAAVLQMQIPSRRFEVSFGSGGLNSSVFFGMRASKLVNGSGVESCGVNYDGSIRYKTCCQPRFDEAIFQRELDDLANLNG